MDLGKAKLLRTGLNALHQAIHPVHGIAWTDGRQVCLTSFCFGGGEVKFGDTNVIGQFEHVLGLSWGPACRAGTPALLAVQHKKRVTVWQLQLSALEHDKLLCTQTCEATEPVPLLPQGCVWHPRLDVLAVVTQQDASALFSPRVDNCCVRAEARGGGGAGAPIHGACWTGDGSRLVVAAGNTLLSYTWSDAHKSLAPCAFCPVFDVGGYVRAVRAAGDARVAVTTELPLDKLCGLNADLTFEMPDEAEVGSSGGGRGLWDDNEKHDHRRKSFEYEHSCLSAGNGQGPVDLTGLLSRHRRSDPSPLLHLRRRDAAVTGSGRDSSHLVLVSYERQATVTRRVAVPGVLSPDIVALDAGSSTVAVASNACSAVLVYRVTAAGMPVVQRVTLGDGERPKGVCFLDDRTLLLMVGRQRASDPAFLPSSSADKYLLRLAVHDLAHHEDSPSPSARRTVSPALSLRRHSEQPVVAYDREQRPGIWDLVLPGGGRGVLGRHLVEELRSSPERSPVASSTDVSDLADSSSSSLAAEDIGREPPGGRVGVWAGGFQSSKVPAEPSPLQRAGVGDRDGGVGGGARERTLQQLVLSMERLAARFADVQRCVAEVGGHAHNGRKAAGTYPSACDEPPYVNVTCQKQLPEFTDERRPVLLCEGKLCLRVVQDLFNISVVEMMHGPMWVVLVADTNGYVPLTFQPKEELTVRNGKRSSSLRIPGSTEASCPPSPVLKPRSSSNTIPSTSPEPSTRNPPTPTLPSPSTGLQPM